MTVIQKLKISNDTMIINGEVGSSIEMLPVSWQKIANGTIKLKSKKQDQLVEMAQLFHYKMKNGQFDLFLNEKFSKYKEALKAITSELAEETLLFYGDDFQDHAYPNFDEIRNYCMQQSDSVDRLRVLNVCLDLFKEFGYEMPASFYEVHLAPIFRDSIDEIRYLRFSPQDRMSARSWDAVLHAEKVFAIQMKIQSITSMHGFTWEHGCSCSHKINDYDMKLDKKGFDYTIDPSLADNMFKAYIWTLFGEYAYFGLWPISSSLLK
jgi:hypothetical protein